MTAIQRRPAFCSTSLLLVLAITGCGQKEVPTPASPPLPLPAPVVKPVILKLTPQRISALAPLAVKSPVIFGEAPKASYNWRFGPSEDHLVIWATFDAAWSATEFSSVILTSGYTIESDLAAELDVAAAILEMNRSDLDKKIMPIQKIGGVDVKVFSTGEFTHNGLSVHYTFEDNSGINGHTKPDLMVSIMPESYRTFAIEQARNKKEEKQ